MTNNEIIKKANIESDFSKRLVDLFFHLFPESVANKGLSRREKVVNHIIKRYKAYLESLGKNAFRPIGNEGINVTERKKRSVKQLKSWIALNESSKKPNGPRRETLVNTRVLDFVNHVLNEQGISLDAEAVLLDAEPLPLTDIPAGHDVYEPAKAYLSYYGQNVDRVDHRAQQFGKSKQYLISRMHTDRNALVQELIEVTEPRNGSCRIDLFTTVGLPGKNKKVPQHGNAFFFSNCLCFIVFRPLVKHSNNDANELKNGEPTCDRSENAEDGHASGLAPTFYLFDSGSTEQIFNTSMAGVWLSPGDGDYGPASGRCILELASGREERIYASDSEEYKSYRPLVNNLPITTKADLALKFTSELLFRGPENFFKNSNESNTTPQRPTSNSEPLGINELKLMGALVGQSCPQIGGSYIRVSDLAISKMTNNEIRNALDALQNKGAILVHNSDGALHDHALSITEEGRILWAKHAFGW